MSELKGTLLVVDDEAEIREIIEVNVAALGLTVLEAGDGEQAIEILKSHQVDVVISDLMMPRMSGLTLLSEMREQSYMQPFIFVTAYPSQDSTIQALRLGAFDYVEKPFDSEDLKALIQEALRVNREMVRLGIKGEPSNTVHSNESQAVLEIQRLRTLRFAEEKNQGTDTGPSREKLLDMFVSEAMPQILFCDAAIKGLCNPDERTFELGFLFRVMQAVRMAADAVSARGVAEVAFLAERFYTALRVRQRAVSEEIIALASRLNEMLRVQIDQVGQMPSAVKGRDEALFDEVDSVTKSLERTRAS